MLNDHKHDDAISILEQVASSCLKVARNRENYKIIIRLILLHILLHT